MAILPRPRPQSLTTILRGVKFRCKKCTNFVRDNLSSLRRVRDVDISMAEQVICVQHDGEQTESIVRAVLGAGLEVHDAATYDVNGECIWTGESLPKPIVSCPELCKRSSQTAQCCSDPSTNSRKKRRTASTLDTLRRSLTTLVSGTAQPHACLTEADLEEGNTLTCCTDESSTLAVETDGADDEPDIKPQSYSVQISIEGMTCASCSGSITEAVQALAFVDDVQVNLIGHSAIVKHRGKRSDTDVILETIEDVGFGVHLDSLEVISPSKLSRPSKPFVVTLSVEGMTCGSCVGTVTRGLNELDKVLSANVDLVGNSAAVVVTEKGAANEVLRKIEDLGYEGSVVKLEPLSPTTNGVRSDERTAQFRLSGLDDSTVSTEVINHLHGTFKNKIDVFEHPSVQDPRVSIRYTPDPPSLTVRALKAVIEASNPLIVANPYRPPSLEERSRRVRRLERQRMLRHLLVTLIIAIPSFVIGVVYMGLVPKDDATRRWFEEPIWAGTAMRIDWAMFVLTTPAYFYGASIFHLKALREIWYLWRPKSTTPFLRRFYRFGSMNLLISAGTSVAYFASLAVLIMQASTPYDPQRRQVQYRSSTTYFDTVTFLTLFILIGRVLEAYSKSKTGDAIAMLVNLRPQNASLVETEEGAEGEVNYRSSHISVDLLEVGDTLSVPHGSSPPTDGVVAQEGTFLFDESSLTGESRPAKKTLGDKVFTGSVNVGDPLRMTVTSTGGKSLLDEIIAVVREGQTKRAPIERFADILTGYFTPVITLLAISTWVTWLALGYSGSLPQSWLDVNQGGWAFWSVEFAIAVFVVACPCGMGLAAPTALFVGGGLAAKAGVLVQGGGEAFQEASRIDALVFDKTGTLTEGRMRVTELEFVDPNVEQEKRQVALALAKALEEASSHPIAKAIADFCVSNETEEKEVVVHDIEIREVSGQGMYGRFKVQTASSAKPAVYAVALGNERLTDGLSEPDDRAAETPNTFLAQILGRLQSQGNTTAILSMCEERVENGNSSTLRPVAVFAITDPVREEAPSILSALRQQHIEVYMCTGDNQRTAHAIASQLAIPVANVRAEVLPQDKAAYIHELQSQSKSDLQPQLQPTTTSPSSFTPTTSLPRSQAQKSTANLDQSRHTRPPASRQRPVIGFVGDGTNDSPALSAADVSVAMSSGSDIAMTTASFILLTNDLNSILTLIRLAKRVFWRVKLNFAWAAVYNICLIPVAAGVFFPLGQWRLSPVWASAAMAASSISVVLSSLALRLPEVGFRTFPP